jgi:hypothetical protein
MLLLLLHPSQSQQRLMSNLALSRIRTGRAAYMAEDREIAVLRKSDMLLGPTPTDAALQAEANAAAGTAAAAAAAAAEDSRNSNVMMTSSGRRVKVRGRFRHVVANCKQTSLGSVHSVEP